MLRIIFESNVTTTYVNSNVNKWSLVGPGNADIHSIDTKNIDLDDLTFDIDGIMMDIKSPLLVSSTFRFYKGVLTANSQKITTGSMFVGYPGYNNDN